MTFDSITRSVTMRHRGDLKTNILYFAMKLYTYFQNGNLAFNWPFRKPLTQNALFYGLLSFSFFSKHFIKIASRL